MLEILYSIFGFVVAVGILISFHEFGHFITARLFGVRVIRFSIGFGRPIWKRNFGIDRSEFVISAIPLGGYVRMLDKRVDEVPAADIDKTFNSKSLLARGMIVLAGPAANFVLAVFFFWIALVAGIPGLPPTVGQVLPEALGAQLGLRSGDQIEEIDQRAVQTWNEYDLYLLRQSMKNRSIALTISSRDGRRRSIIVKSDQLPTGRAYQNVLVTGLGLSPALPESVARIGSVINNSPAEQAGLQAGDTIEAIDTLPINTWSDLVEVVSGQPLQKLNIQLIRNGDRLSVEMIPELVEVKDEKIGRIGVTRDMAALPVTTLKLDLVQSLVRSVENTYILSELTVRTIIQMIKLKITTETIGGPVTIARVAGQSAKTGIVPYLLFLAIVSISLGVLNLLPIPLLDGGHLLYLFLEGVRGAPLTDRAMQIGQSIGVGILAVLMFIAFYNDFSALTFPP